MRNRPGELAPVIRQNGTEVELVELVWGLKPSSAEGRLVINIRSEGRKFSARRCLVPATEFTLRDPDSPGTRWRFTLVDGESFYLAGVWHPAEGDWPEAFALLTTAANPDIAPVSNRQMAVITRPARMDWLEAVVPEPDVLRPLPAGTFRRERLQAGR